MNIEWAKERQAVLRKKQRQLRRQIDALQEAVRKGGNDPGASAQT